MKLFYISMCLRDLWSIIMPVYNENIIMPVYNENIIMPVYNENIIMLIWLYYRLHLNCISQQLPISHHSNQQIKCLGVIYSSMHNYCKSNYNTGTNRMWILHVSLQLMMKIDECNNMTAHSTSTWDFSASDWVCPTLSPQLMVYIQHASFALQELVWP